MEPFRKYGSAPFHVVVIHGGPGTLGSAAPIARQLGQGRGVLEPLQTATTLDRQVEELRLVVERHATPPVIFIGHSWGAWLSALVTAAYPDLVRKLILVGCGPFEEQYVPTIAENRFKRLSPQENASILQERFVNGLMAESQHSAPIVTLTQSLVQHPAIPSQMNSSIPCVSIGSGNCGEGWKRLLSCFIASQEIGQKICNGGG